MNLHQEISYPDFLVLLLDYYKKTGLSHSFLIDYLHDYSKAIYALKQYVLLDNDGFLTWAYFNKANEEAFLRGDVGIFNHDDLSNGDNLWVIDAACTKGRGGAFLRAFRRLYAPRFDRCKCLFLNKGEQSFREVIFV